MQGIIESAKMSQSGKNVTLYINNTRYTSKNREFLQMVGQEITFESTRQDFDDGGHIDWINEYGVTNASTTPSGQAFDQAHAQTNAGGYTGPNPAHDGPPPMGSPNPPVNLPGQMTQAQQAPQRPPVDRDASITALALVKCIQGINSTDMALAAYKDLYYKILEWNPE